MLPLVSVVIAVYNGERWLDEALGSALSQEVRELELIAVDDGSTDTTLRLLQAWCRRDERVRVVPLPRNTGYVHACNTGVEGARAPWVARLDADDVWLPGKLERQLSFVERNPETVLVGTGVVLIDTRSRQIGRNVTLPCGHADIDAALLAGGWPLVHSSTLIRTQAFRAVGGYRAQFPRNQDHDLFLRLAERARLANLPERLTRYRIHGSAVSAADKGMLYGVLRDACSRRGVEYPAPSAPRGAWGLNYELDHVFNVSHLRPLRRAFLGSFSAASAWRLAKLYARGYGWWLRRRVLRLLRSND